MRRPLAVPVFGRELRLSGRVTAANEAFIDRLRRFDVRDPEGEPERGRRPFADEVDLDQRIEVDVFYTFTDRIALYLAGQVEWQNLVYSDFSPEIQRSSIARKEAWVYVGDPFIDPLGIQVGAQRFSDDHQWWWDFDLDAARLRWDGRRFSAFLSVAEQLLPRQVGTDRIAAFEQDVFRILAEGYWTLPDDHVVALRVLHHDDGSPNYRVGECVPSAPGLFFRFGCIDPKREDPSDARLTWIGGHAAGRIKLRRFGQIHYRVDGAYLFGDETSYDLAGPDPETGEARRAAAADRHGVHGHGFDVGLQWELDLPGHPTWIASYAFGSGHPNDDADKQRGFRQTGIHDNGDKYRGVATLDYYGELLGPELSNLEIWTAGVGVRLFDSSSLDFLYHHYRQDETADFLRDTSIRRRPYGENKHIGDEFDAILGIEEWERFEIKAVFGVFRSGRAFRPGDGDFSYLASLRFRMNF
ncbi:MAG: alginate export family protein [Deltaproteobacteria bacterium]|nr:alginate export family protein [Deltaproteobacteria bacterium]